MRTFTCDRCGQLVFLDDTVCLRCQASLGFEPGLGRITLVTDPARRCVNAELIGCSWLARSPGELCASCVLTRTRPADGDPAGLAAWAAVESDKRRLVFQLLDLGLPASPRNAAGEGLAFDLLSSAHGPVTTGHAQGVITLDLAESDDVHRERVRAELGESYRTVLGHLRHEVGHRYFDVLVGPTDRDEARRLFGDESVDYTAALERHYAEGPPPDWRETHVSAYATMHPSEDWAETFAHYLHIRATLQTAASYRLSVAGPAEVADADAYASDPAATSLDTIEDVIATWLPLSYALNAVNRSMGGADLYPFVLAPPVMTKLGFVHRMVGRNRAA